MNILDTSRTITWIKKCLLLCAFSSTNATNIYTHHIWSNACDSQAKSIKYQKCPVGFLMSLEAPFRPWYRYPLEPLAPSCAGLCTNSVLPSPLCQKEEAWTTLLSEKLKLIKRNVFHSSQLVNRWPIIKNVYSCIFYK